MVDLSSVSALLNSQIGTLIVADWLSWFFIVSGSFFALVGALGLVRLPDVFSRMHGAGMVDTLGIMMILVGLMFQTSEPIQVLKLVLILVFVIFTSPTSTFALARAAIHGGVNPGPSMEELKEIEKSKAEAKPSNT